MILPQMSAEHSETINEAISSTCLVLTVDTKPAPSRHADTFSISLTPLCKDVRLSLYVIEHSACPQLASRHVFGPCENQIILKQGGGEGALP